MRVICSILIAGLVIAGITSYILIKKYYLAYNLLKLDPLEEKSSEIINSTYSESNDGIWLTGDLRIARWDPELFPSFGLRVSNFGIEGQTTSQVLLRFKNQLVKATPRWVLLEVGVNDLKIIGIDRDQADVIKETCFSNIISVAKLCKEHNINIIVINIFPTGEIEFLRRFIWNASVDMAIVEINDRLKSYCINNDVYYFDAYDLLTGLSTDRTVKKMYQEDFLHINEEAYKLLTKNLINQYGDLITSDNDNTIQPVK